MCRLTLAGMPVLKFAKTPPLLTDILLHSPRVKRTRNAVRVDDCRRNRAGTAPRVSVTLCGCDEGLRDFEPD